jgi:hypothetical protein
VFDLAHEFPAHPAVLGNHPRTPLTPFRVRQESKDDTALVSIGAGLPVFVGLTGVQHGVAFIALAHLSREPSESGLSRRIDAVKTISEPVHATIKEDQDGTQVVPLTVESRVLGDHA